MKFLLKEGCNWTTIHQRLVDVYGDSAPNYCTVTRWFSEFKRGHQSLEDDPRSGQSLDAVNLISVAAVEKLIMANRRVNVSEIAKELQIAAGSVKNIILNIFICRRCLLIGCRNLSLHDQLKCVASCQELLDLYTSCLLYTSPSPRDGLLSRMPSSA